MPNTSKIVLTCKQTDTLHILLLYQFSEKDHMTNCISKNKQMDFKEQIKPKTQNLYSQKGAVVPKPQSTNFQRRPVFPF